MYKILDALTQTFFPVLTRIDDDIDEIEQQVIEDPREDNPEAKSTWIKQDVDSTFGVSSHPSAMCSLATRSGSPSCAGSRAMAGSTSATSTTASTASRSWSNSYRDLLSGAADMYLSTVANRQGEVNKQLTMIATIFLPLTFLTGFFGQRCRHATAASSSSRRRQLRPLRSRAGYALAGTGPSTRRGSSVSRAITNR